MSQFQINATDGEAVFKTGPMPQGVATALYNGLSTYVGYLRQHPEADTTVDTDKVDVKMVPVEDAKK